MGLLYGPTTARVVLTGAALAFLPVDLMRLRGGTMASRLPDLVPVFRAREANRLSGASLLLVALAATAWLPWPAAGVGILAGALADPVASLIGTWLAPARVGGKSIPGSMAAASTGAAGALFLGLNPAGAVAVGIVTAAAERWGLYDDNLWVAPAAALAALFSA